MFSCDISGIQKFIYTINSKKALKTLRSRSFYVEMLMEHFISKLLSGCGLYRSNLIYSGGGHCYILLPNTSKVKEIVKMFTVSVNQWLLERFNTLLYIATGFTECSANELMNKGADENNSPYKNIFKRVSISLADSKLHRYDAKAITFLNTTSSTELGRECKICGSVERLSNNIEKCNLCE